MNNKSLSSSPEEEVSRLFGGEFSQPNIQDVVKQTLKSGVPFLQLADRLKTSIRGMQDEANAVSEIRSNNLTPELFQRAMPTVMGLSLPKDPVARAEVVRPPASMANAKFQPISNFPRTDVTKGRLYDESKPFYHGSKAADIIEKEGFKKMPIQTGVSAFGEGSYLTTSRRNAKGYGGVVNAYLPKDLKLKKVSDADAYKVDTKKLIQEGYDGVELDTGSGKNITIFDPSIIKTKSQLKSPSLPPSTRGEIGKLLDENTALRSARQGTGQFQGGEVYQQDLGRLGVRQVLVQGKDAQGNILGWYLPDKKTAGLLGQQSGFLQEARFKPSELQVSQTPTEQIKSAINFMFPEKPIAGEIGKGVENGDIIQQALEERLK